MQKGNFFKKLIIVFMSIKKIIVETKNNFSFSFLIKKKLYLCTVPFLGMECNFFIDKQSKVNKLKRKIYGS
jgi:6-pyruvoyl-tetrahydropterin synthase